LPAREKGSLSRGRAAPVSGDLGVEHGACGFETKSA